MGKYILIIIVIFIILFLSMKLIILKKQLKWMSRQLEAEEPECNSVSIEMIDRDLERLTLDINRILSENREHKSEADKILRWEKGAIAAVSHDMRTPLTSIMGYLQLIQKSELTEEQRGYLSIVMRKAEGLHSLIQDFFELSLLEANEDLIELSEVDLSEVLQESILEHYLQFETRGIKPVFKHSEAGVIVRADKGMLERIVQNLISNGIKHGEGDLFFSIMEKENRVFLTVKNQVTDMQDIDVDHIFDKFYKSDHSRAGQGTGLGLYTVKLLAEKMGGKVKAEKQGEYLSILVGFR